MKKLNKISSYLRLIHNAGVKNSLKYFYSKRISGNWRLIYSSRFGYKFVPFSEIGFFWLAGLKEPETVSWFNRNITNYNLFINVGAGWGEYALMALTRHVPTLIFEPNPRLNRIIHFNLSLNSYRENIDYWLFSCAVGTPKRRERFIIQNPEGTSHLESYGRRKFEKLASIEVDVIPLSEFKHLMQDYDDVLFLIDAEGAEIEVIKSIPERVRCRADFIIESAEDQIKYLNVLLKGKRKYKLEDNPSQKNLGNYVWVRKSS